MATNTLELSPFDQIIPRIYVRKLFCFPFPDVKRQSGAVEALEQSLSAVIMRWPFITGIVGPAHAETQDVRPNTVELQYTTPVKTNLEQLEHKVLMVKTLSRYEFPWTYEELSEADMPPSAMQKTVLSGVPEHPKPGETCPALNIQANFIEGGLIICFAFHHAVADGASFLTFIKALTAAMKQSSPPGPVSDVAVEKRFGYTADVDHAPEFGNFSEYDFGNTQKRKLSQRVTTSRILILKATLVKALEQDINQRLKAKKDDSVWVTATDCLAGLMWVAITQARSPGLERTDKVKFGSAVDFRGRKNPPLRADYFGNAIIHAIATAKVSELVGLTMGGNLAPININAVMLAAERVHDAIQGVDSGNVDERLNILSAISDPTSITRAYKRVLDTAYTGVDFSSWRDQGADVEFDIPGAATKKVDFWRKTHSANEGVCNILPRKGGSKGDADWELLLALSVDEMQKVCSDLTVWVDRVVE